MIEVSNVEVKHWFKDHAYQNTPLNYEEAYSLGVYTLEGCSPENNLAQKQSIAALCALHTKATYSWSWTNQQSRTHGHRLPLNAAEQIAGICAAVFEHDIAKSMFGFLQPNIPYAMDNCGMGGDLIITANVSTVAAFIAAAAGIPMCKHGSPANADAGRHGSSDFIVLCGINEYASKKQAEECVESLSFGYTEALDERYKKIHKQTHEIAKLPHMNDIIGPITNPLDPILLTRRVLGVNHLISPKIVADAYCILNEKRVTNLKHGLFIRGIVDYSQMQGIDELSICLPGSEIVELKDGKINEYQLKAEDFGLKSTPFDSVSPSADLNKGDFSLAILKGKITGESAQMIAANAALLFYLAEKSQDLKECYCMAEEILLSGKAYEKMLAVKKILPK